MNLRDAFEEIKTSSERNGDLLGNYVTANFMLDPSSGKEIPLRSTLERELGFSAHHAVHHMAMAKIIALNHLGLHSEALPDDFGRAPSTVHSENSSNLKAREH